MPTGSRIRVDYADPDVPTLSVRVQEVFGWAQAPLVAGRPLRLQLLSPARRVVATTADLAAFWVTGYPAVRSELRGRYPRHPWPEDPAVASATKRAQAAPLRLRAVARPGEDQRVTPTPTTDEWGIDASWLDALDEEHAVAAGHHRPAARGDRHAPGRPRGARADRRPPRRRAGGRRGRRRLRGRRGAAHRRRAARATSRSATTGCSRPRAADAG